MSVPEFIQRRFDRINDQIASDEICVMETSERGTGVPRYLICSVLRVGDAVHLAPIGEVFDEARQERVYAEVEAP